MIATQRAFNFYAGPATLPLSVLAKAQDELLDFAQTGMSVMELSHRSKPYMAVQAKAEELVRELLGVSDDYAVLFLQGGASLQFSMAPLNLVPNGEAADYILTDDWSKKALKEAKLYTKPTVLATSESDNFNHIPELSNLTSTGQYVHITSNNTIAGTQFHQAFPDNFKGKLVADMSSEIMSRELDITDYGLIYAGAQKNLGPSGVTLVIVKKSWIRDDLSAPTMLQYHTHAQAESMYNTPPTFGIYLLKNVLEWVKNEGGVSKLSHLAAEKSGLIYDVIDRYPEIYQGHSLKGSRSQMNITFKMADENLFVKAAEAKGLIGLAGHRSVGGIRASIYNAMPIAGVEALAQLMRQWAEGNR
jgi:phosphoserine aminotransferase